MKVPRLGEDKKEGKKEEEQKEEWPHWHWALNVVIEDKGIASQFFACIWIFKIGSGCKKAILQFKNLKFDLVVYFGKK